jgi:long-chain acyl-CoA synthetase
MPDIVLGEIALSAPVFEHRVQKAAGALRSRGIGEGDGVAVVLRNDIAFLEVALAARRIGAQLVPVNCNFAPSEIAYVLSDSGCKLAVIDGHVLATARDALSASVDVVASWPAPEVAATSGLPAVGGNGDDWAGLCSAAAPWSGAPRAARTAMSYTSGTTGHPKGVRRPALSAEEAQAVAALNRTVFGLSEGARVLIPAPLYHGAPQAYFQFALQVAADTLVIMPRFDARAMLEAIARHRITHLYAVPTMFVRLLGLPEAERTQYDLSSLTFVLHGAAPCAPDIKRAMINWWGTVIHEFYGGTEAGPIAAISSVEWLERPGSVGRAAPGARIAILDSDGAPLPPGQAGRIFVRQTAYPDFTYHCREDERARIGQGDLFTLGDVGHLDADGYLYITDREKDLVISGGVNIYPAEIEKVLIAHPEIDDCAVIGLPDPDLGERAVAFVVPARGSTPNLDGVIRFLTGRLSKQKFPRELIPVATLPRQESGKIFKRKLVQDILDKTSRPKTEPRPIEEETQP